MEGSNHPTFECGDTGQERRNSITTAYATEPIQNNDNIEKCGETGQINLEEGKEGYHVESTKVEKERYHVENPEGKPEFVNYMNYFFIENKSRVDIYFEVKNGLKNGNPSLCYLLKYISLLSHIIYFHEMKHQKLLTSIDVENIKNVIYKNEDINANSYSVTYNCLVFLLEIIKLSTHIGVKCYAYFQLVRNFNTIKVLFLCNFTFHKIKNKDNFYILRENEAVFIDNFVTLNIVHILNNENKILRICGLKLCHLFVKNICHNSYILNYVLNTIWKEINYDEFVHALSIFTQMIQFLNNDVVYHVVKKMYLTLLVRRKEGGKCFYGKPFYSNYFNTNILFDDKNRKNETSNDSICVNNKGNTHFNKKEFKNENLLHIVRDHFSYTTCIFLGKIATKLHNFMPYVSYYLYTKLWNIINNLFEIDFLPDHDQVIINILDLYFYSTTLLSCKNETLLNLQIFTLKFILNVPQTELMTKRNISYFALRSILFLIKNKKMNITLYKFVEEKEEKHSIEKNDPYYCYFSFISTITDYELIHWMNRLQLRNDLTTFMFVRIVYTFFKAQKNNINCFNHAREESIKGDQLPSVNNLYGDLFINKFLSTLEEVTPDMYIQRKHELGQNGASFLWCNKSHYATHRNDENIGAKRDVTDIGVDKVEGDRYMKADSLLKENRQGEGNPEGQDRGKFFFTITVSDEDSEKQHGKEKQSKVNENSPINGLEEKRVNSFFENFIKKARENEKNNEVNIKQLDDRKKKKKKKNLSELKTIQGEKGNAKSHSCDVEPNGTSPKSSSGDVYGSRDTGVNGEKNMSEEGKNASMEATKCKKSDAKGKGENSSIASSVSISSEVSSDAISEISNGEGSVADAGEDVPPLTNSHEGEEDAENVDKQFLLYCYDVLKKNKIKLSNLVREDQMDCNYFKDNFFLRFKKIFLKKKKKKIMTSDSYENNQFYYEHLYKCKGTSKENTPSDFTLRNIMFIKILFFLYKHCSFILLKLNILKCVAMMSRYLVYQEDQENFLIIFNYFFVNYVSGKREENGEEAFLSSVRSDIIGASASCPNILAYVHNMGAEKISVTFGHNVFYGSDTSHMGSVIMSSDSSILDEKTNFDLYLSDLQKEKGEGITMERIDISSFRNNRNALNRCVCTYLVDIINKLRNCESCQIINSIFQTFCNDEFIPFFVIFFGLSRESLIHHLCDPFFFLTKKGKDTDVTHGHIDGVHSYSNTTHSQNAWEKASLGDWSGYEMNIRKRADNGENSYLINGSNFLKTFPLFQIDQSSYRNVKLLFYFSFFNFRKNVEIMNGMRKKAFLFLDILDNMFLFKKRGRILCNMHRKDKQLEKKKKTCTRHANEEVMTQSSGDEKKKGNGTTGVFSRLELHRVKAVESSSGGGQINEKGNLSCAAANLSSAEANLSGAAANLSGAAANLSGAEANLSGAAANLSGAEANLLCEREIFINQSESNVANSSDTCSSSLSSSSYASCASYSSTEESDIHSDDFSLSSVSNKSLKNRVVKTYKNLHNDETIDYYDDIKLDNLKKKINNMSFFYMYRIGIYCISAGFFKHGYDIFKKLSLLVISRDIRLWCTCLMNYSKFYNIKRKMEKNDSKNIFFSPLKFLKISEQCIKKMYNYKNNFFILAIFLKIKWNIYKTMENMIILITDIKDEINFTLKYFFYNIENFIKCLKNIMISLLILFNFNHLFSFISKKILTIYTILVKSLFIFCYFLKQKVIPYLFLNPSFLMDVFVEQDFEGNAIGAIGSIGSIGSPRSSISGAPSASITPSTSSTSNASDASNTSSTSSASSVYSISSKFLYENGVDNMDNVGNPSSGWEHQETFLHVIGTMRSFIRFYVRKGKEKSIRKRLFATELKNIEGKAFNDVFNHVMSLWNMGASDFFFYEYIRKLKEVYDHLFKDNVLSKKRVITFIKICLTVFYKINYPTPPRVLSSIPAPYVSSRTYIYRSNRGKRHHEVESLKCVGRLMIHEKVAHVKKEKIESLFVQGCMLVSEFYYCNVKLILGRKVIRQVDVKARGVHVTYTSHIKIDDNDLKNFHIFLTPLKRNKNLLGQTKATVFFFKYV
ncbi:conserved Plasmodium protein, unknown function [Plasmodium ovale curtisi]|uniref:Uncharacterized protein n=1 Tax=Plasmodium ovale curtisi TaxID=864141 RepID=A0A1A8WDB6_PLAOA|nr:conserved Plasmodium protein, unknown function [Plasmodium ovale curtisi]